VVGVLFSVEAFCYLQGGTEMQRFAEFWKSGTKGKLVISCGGLTALLCLFSFLILLLPNEATQQADEKLTETQVVAEAEPTSARKPTDTSPPTNTSCPTDTPNPTATFAPEPTKALSDISFLQIVERFEQCCVGQQWGPAEEWNSYVESILGERVQWSGLYEFMVDEGTYYRVGVQMSPPQRYGIGNARVDLILPYDIREKLEALNADQMVTFQGEIADIVTAYLVFDCVQLDHVIFLE
jgi:hypothetical protein